MVANLDHFSYVKPSFHGAVWRIAVELDSVAIQAPGGVSNDPWNGIRSVDLDLQHLLQSSSCRPDLSFHQAIRHLKYTHAGGRVRWRIPESGLFCSCLAHRRAYSMLTVRSEHDSLGKSLGTLSTARTNQLLDSESLEIEHSHQFVVRLALRGEVVQLRFGHITSSASLVWQVWHLFRQHSVHICRCVALCSSCSDSWIRSNLDPQFLLASTFVVWSSAPLNFNSSLVQVYLIDPPVLASRRHPWRTATCCPLHRSQSSLSADNRCLAPPAPSSSRSCSRCAGCPRRRPLDCLASSSVCLTQSGTGLPRRPT